MCKKLAVLSEGCKMGDFHVFDPNSGGFPIAALGCSFINCRTMPRCWLACCQNFGTRAEEIRGVSVGHFGGLPNIPNIATVCFLYWNDLKSTTRLDHFVASKKNRDLNQRVPGVSAEPWSVVNPSGTHGE